MTLIETLVLMLILLVGIVLGALGASFFGALGGAIGFMAGLAAPAVLFSLLNTLDALFRGRVSTSSGTPGLLGKVLDHLFATRRRIFALWVLLWTTVYALGALAYHDQAERLQYTLTFWGAVTTLSVLQALFVLPVLRPAPKAKRGKSLAVTLVLAAMLASALLGGIAAALAHVLQDDVRAPTFALVGLLVFLSSWIVWTVLLIRFVSRDRASSREEILTRLAHQLFAGTVVEALLAIPLDVMIRQRESCYCGTGPFLAYVVGFTVGVIVIGPAMVLPAIMRRHHPRYVDHCDRCGRRLEEFGIGTDFRTNALPAGCGACSALLSSVIRKDAEVPR